MRQAFCPDLRAACAQRHRVLLAVAAGWRGASCDVEIELCVFGTNDDLRRRCAAVLKPGLKSSIHAGYRTSIASESPTRFPEAPNFSLGSPRSLIRLAVRSLLPLRHGFSATGPRGLVSGRPAFQGLHTCLRGRPTRRDHACDRKRYLNCDKLSRALAHCGRVTCPGSSKEAAAG